jgi:hypothetical protein
VVATAPNVFGRKLGLAGTICALLVLCALSAAPAFAAGPGWLGPVGLSADGSDAQTPVIAMDAPGDSDAVWAQGTGTLQTSYRQAGPGDPFVEQDVGGSSDSSTPDVAEDGGGDAEAVWIESDSVNWSYRTNDIDGFGGASGINDDTCAGHEIDPRVDVDSNANVIAAYLCSSGAHVDVEAAYAAGGTAGNFNTAPTNPSNVAPVQLSDGSHDASSIQIAEDPNGDAIVVWVEFAGTNTQTWYAYRPEGNSSTWTAPQIVSSVAEDEDLAAVAMDGSGDASVAYVSDGDIGEEDATNSMLAAGDKFAAATTLSTSTTANNPEIADDANGDTAVTWSDSGTAYANVRPAGESFAGTATTLGGVDASSQPQIALTSTRDAIAVWQSGHTIQAETANPSGSFSGTAKQLSGANATEPSLAVDGNGDAVAAWIQPDATNEIATADGYDSGADPNNNNLHIPANGTPNTGLTLYVQPFDVWPAISSVVWKVDGTQIGTGDTVTYVPQSGSHTVSVTSTNAQGNQTVDSQTINIAASAPTLPGGGIAQLASPGDCVTSDAVGCGTLIPYGLNTAYQPVVSPDGKTVYGVAQTGGIVEFSRDSNTGALTEIGCLTAAASGCSGAGSFENVAGLNNPAALAISPDGTSAYAVAQGGDNAIVSFSRDTTSGLLTPQAGGCYSSDTPTPPTGCTEDPGLGLSYGVVVSQDGKNVYASGDAGHDVAEFTRNTTNGAIAPIAGNDCISDGTEPACDVQGANGLLNAIGVSAVGSNVYVTAGGTFGSGDIAEFTRNASTGALGSDNPCVGSSTAPAPCSQTAPAINGTEDMAISPSGKFAYVNSSSDDAVVELSRNTTTGAMSQIGCVETSSGPAGLCTTSNAVGIDIPLGVAISPDGSNLYVSGAGDNAEAAFAINTDGTLTQLASPTDCITSNSGGCGVNAATGLNGPRRVAVSPDGKNVYVAGQGSDAITVLARTPQPSSSPPPPPTTGQIQNGGEASWDTSSTATNSSVTVTVPAVVCGAVKSGTYAGQAAGVELYGQESVSGQTVYPAEVADVRTYCDGPKAQYETSFVVNDETNGTRVTHPAGLTVSPGDPLAISTTASSSGASMKITDVNTGKSASITGPGFVASDGADIGVQPIESNGHGAPLLSGSQSAAATTATIDGPVQSSPIVFQNALVDGQPISSASTFYGLRWVNSSKTVVATPSAISGGDFAVDFASVPTPATGKSGDAAPVSGKVLIELPGTHKFVPLTSIKQIPNGTIINAIHGSVQITVKLPNGQTQTGVFFDGEFKFEQAKSGKTTAVLVGGSFKGCPKPPAKHPHHKKHKKPKKSKQHGTRAPVAQAARKKPKSKVRSLWSNAHGSFGTSGQYGASAVRGTEWLTVDQCDGTFFRVTRDEITVTSFSLHNRKTTVKQGHSFLAPAPGFK